MLFCFYFERIATLLAAVGTSSDVISANDALVTREQKPTSPRDESMFSRSPQNKQHEYNRYTSRYNHHIVYNIPSTLVTIPSGIILGNRIVRFEKNDLK
jgi:hypothetical protein